MENLILEHFMSLAPRSLPPEDITKIEHLRVVLSLKKWVKDPREPRRDVMLGDGRNQANPVPERIGA